MRPASIFLIIQLSNFRAHSSDWINRCFIDVVFRIQESRVKILSLTVVGRKNRCIPYIYWVTAIFTVVTNYSNLFRPFAFFLDCSHFTFGYELIVCPETTGFMKIICDLFTLI